MKRLEILAPAGGTESVYPAVRVGADAVYLGAKKLSARGSAQNFDREELKKAVEYCHACGVRVYLACNTLLRDAEMKDALDIIEYACEIPVDALIVQDLGLASIIRRSAPDMRLHASTQMSVHTPDGVRLLAEMGFKRVVLSRELSRKELEEIAKDSPIELEVFVHGALCMSVSGQCYFSSVLGSRSGNRGLCAQPCRLPFGVSGGTGHDLSLKDNSLVPYLRDLQEMGIASAKIEGRMKRPEYVAVSVAACRQSLDKGSVDKELAEKLRAVFSRSGFTDGYFTGRRGADMFGIRSRDDTACATSKVFNSIHTMYKNEKSKIPVDIKLNICRSQPSSITVSDDIGNSAVVLGAVPERAEKTALDREKCFAGMNKTGGTPFFLRDFDLNLDDGLFVSLPSLNSLRREALDLLFEKRKKRRAITFSNISLPETGTRKAKTNTKTRARFVNGNIPDEFLCCELVYVPINLKDDEYISLMDRGFALAVEIPRGMFGLEKYIYERLKKIKSLGINEVLASNLGAVKIAQTLDMDIHGGFGLNITNTSSVKWAEEQGFLDAEISFELTLEQISELGGVLPLGIISYGRLPLMLTRLCPAQNDGKGCKSCKTAPFLTDRKNLKFPMLCYGSCTEILNSVPVILSDRKKDIKGVDFEVLRFTVENLVETGENLRLFNQKLCRKSGFTRGLYYRGVE